MKQYRSNLNTQENSISLELFNQDYFHIFLGTRVIQKPISRFTLQVCWLVSIRCRFLVEGVSERILAIYDTYMINTVVIIVKCFGTSSKHILLKYQISSIVILMIFICFYLVFLLTKKNFENGLWRVSLNIQLKIILTILLFSKNVYPSAIIYNQNLCLN